MRVRIPFSGVNAMNSPAAAVDHVRPLLVSAQQAARLLSIGRTTLYELIKRREVTPIHIGRCVRFSVVELTGLVERLSSAQTPADVVPAAPAKAATRRSSAQRGAACAEQTLF